MFLPWFTKENVLSALDEQNALTAICRLIDSGKPVYASMKMTRMQRTNRIILGISIIDAQMKQQIRMEKVEKERDALARVMALAEDYLCLYAVEPESGRYIEYTTTTDYETLGLDREGDDFFGQSIINGQRAVYGEDLPKFLEGFTKEKVLGSIRETGKFTLNYRLLIQGEPVNVTLKIAPFQSGNEEKLLAGVRKWRQRKH